MKRSAIHVMVYSDILKYDWDRVRTTHTTANIRPVNNWRGHLSNSWIDLLLISPPSVNSATEVFRHSGALQIGLLFFLPTGTSFPGA